MITNALRRFERVAPFRIGLVLFVLVLAVGLALFQKTKIVTALSPGEDLAVEFDRNYRVRADVTKVKIAGIPVGIVTDVETQPDGSTRVSMHLEPGMKEKLRTEPSAAIRPTTLMGGNYYIDLRPGGDPGEADGDVPAERTSTPVELDRVLEVLRPEARRSTQRTVSRLDATLDRDGRRSVRSLAGSAPGTLRPAAGVLEAVQGTRPGTDLTALTRHLESTARTLNAKRGQLDSAVSSLSDVSDMLADTSPALATALDDLPGALANTRRGLGALSGTLTELRSVADEARPIVQELDGTLAELDPALAAAAPVVRDLRPALRDLRPVVDELVPAAVDATGILADVDGAPLDRIRGPIVRTVNSSWHGTGDYADGGNDTVFYRELGDLIAGMSDAARMTDANGSTIHFQPGFGVGSVSGMPISFEKLLMQLAYPGGAP